MSCAQGWELFSAIWLGPKTSGCEEKYVTVVSTVPSCDMTRCATTWHKFNKHASSRRETVSDSRGNPRCTEKNFTKIRMLTCVDRSTQQIHHSRIQRFPQSFVATVLFDRWPRLAQLSTHAKHGSQSVESLTSQHFRSEVTWIHICLDWWHR